jgi:2-polyprenyl-3-methyl-5-hydroxy-6-metoxy-1,4-benzoquinol methylase
LPRHIIDECRDVHDFDFFIFEKEHITHEQWKNYNGGGEYPVTELIKFKNTVLDLSEYIYDKNIVDFACHAGLTSLVCLHNGARSVVATNVREEFVNLANECMSLSEFKNQFIAITADIHDYKINTKLSANCDTVLLYGIMYHVHDHVEIIESIVKSTPRYIIFDTDLDHSTKDDPRPLISWKTENSSFALAGYYNNYKTVPIGAPNESWFDLIMTSFQYKLVRNQRYDCAAPGKFDITLSRSVMVYEFNPTTISGTNIHDN